MAKTSFRGYVLLLSPWVFILALLARLIKATLVKLTDLLLK